MALDVGEDRKRKAGERIKRASCLPTPTLGLFGCAARSTCTLAPLAPLRPCAPLRPPWPPLGPFPTLCNPSRPSQPACNPSRPLTPPHDPFRPPYRPKALDCHALEQAIGEGKAAELPAEDLKAAEAVLEKARAAEKAKCEKDLRDKMKARSLSGLTPPESPHYSAPRPRTTAPPVPLLPFRRRGRCWVSTSRASARRSHAPSRSGCPASYSSRPRPSCPKRRGRTSSRERARHLARAGDACTGRVARACTPGGRMKLAACFHFSLDEPPVDAEPRPAWASGDSFWGRTT